MVHGGSRGGSSRAYAYAFFNQQGNVIPRKTSHYVVCLKHIPTHQNHGNSWPTEKTYRKEIPIKVLMKEKLSFNKQLIY